MLLEAICSFKKMFSRVEISIRRHERGALLVSFKTSKPSTNGRFRQTGCATILHNTLLGFSGIYFHQQAIRNQNMKLSFAYYILLYFVLTKSLEKMVSLKKENLRFKKK